MSLPGLQHTDVPSARPAIWRYGVAMGAVSVALAIRLLLATIIATDDAPFLLFFAAVMASGWYGGFRAGLFATVLCAVVAACFIGDPPDSFHYDRITWDILRISGFILEGVITSALCGRLHNARQRAELNAAEARELERTVEQIAEAEQRRIGQDLHDGLGQHLTGVAFLSKALQRKLIAEGRPEAADANTINDLVNESIRWTRDLARGLAPMDLDRTSLPESLKDLARKTSRIFNVECIYEGVETVLLPDDEMALNLYRVAQEAVSNGVKHGQARRITIDLRMNKGLQLEVQDDGVGFDAAAVIAAPDRKGMGLLVMRYRAGVIGGALEIQRGTSGGTIVRCNVPASKAQLPQIARRSGVWKSDAEPAPAALSNHEPLRGSPVQTVNHQESIP